MVSNFLSGRGGNRGVCEELAARLQTLDWQVMTTSSYSVRPLRISDMVTTAWSQRRKYDVAQIDVFSGPAFRWAEAVAWTLRRAGKPYVLTLHGGRLPQFARENPRRVRQLLESAAAVTTPSRFLLEEFAGYCNDIQLIPNALDVDRYFARTRIHPQAKLIWLRALHNVYEPTMAARVVARLQADFPDLSLRMVGPDKLDGSSEQLRKLIADLEIGQRVELVGGVAKSQVPQELDRGDIFLNTTTIDNTPVSVLEAMCAGMCIVSTDVGGLPYLLDNGRDALLVPSGDVDAMAAAVRRILTEPELAANLSANARRKAEQFDWSVVLPCWDELLNGVRNVRPSFSFASQRSPQTQ